MKRHRYFVYILATGKNGTLYIGVTDNLIRRVGEHKSLQLSGFTQRYKIDQLVWFGETNDINEAIKKERQLKRWKRLWKIRLIEEMNPEWKDLFDTFY